MNVFAWYMYNSHAYNVMQDDDRRGDGYMNAYSPILSQLPWMPIVGK
jgi:hypothetical protein